MISNVTRTYSPKDVILNYTCGECKRRNSILILSHVTSVVDICKTCESINEIKVIVCPECNSSESVTHNDSPPLTGTPYFYYKCIKCDILFK